MSYEPHPCLIAVTGFKGSGKDTACLGLTEELGFENLKFAAALKNMLRAVIRAQGVDEIEVERWVEGDFKEMSCPFLSADILSTNEVHDLMLYELIAYQGVDDERIEYLCRGSMANVPLVYLGGRSFNYCKEALSYWAIVASKGDPNANVSPRYAMQTLGTEWGRESISPSLWTDATNRRVDLFDRVVITDLRFPNENDYILSKGGERIRVERPGNEMDASHPSETYTADMPVDQEIINDSNIRTLMNRMKRAAEDRFGDLS